MIRKFADLFEDEIAEELRSAGPRAVIRTGPHEYRKSCTVCADGIYESIPDTLAEFIEGRYIGIIGRAWLINKLAHTEFTIETED